MICVYGKYLKSADHGKCFVLYKFHCWRCVHKFMCKCQQLQPGAGNNGVQTVVVIHQFSPLVIFRSTCTCISFTYTCIFM